MSTSTDGILAYGYDLGGGDGEFDLVEPNDDYSPYWYDPDDEDEDFAEQAMNRLFGAAVPAGFLTDWDLRESRGVLVAKLGVDVVEYCSNTYTMWLLAAREITASRGDVVAIELSVPDGADERLTWALGVLGIKPKADAPAWLLASYWDGA